MAKKKKAFKDPLAAAINHLMRVRGITNDELGPMVGYKNDKMIDAIRNERSPGSEQKRRAIAKIFEYSYEDFLIFGDKIIKSGDSLSTNPNDLQQKKNELHHKIIDAFQNHKLAVELNQIMIEIEKAGGDEALIMAKGALLSVAGQFKATIHSPKKTGTDQN